MTRALPSLLRCCVAAWLLLLPACSSDPRQGYAFEGAHDSSVRTVAVPVFQNPTYSRTLEVELTDAIIKEIQRSTPWRVTREGNANATLAGTLSDSKLRRLATNSGSGLVQEMEVTLTVDFEFKDNRTGKVLVGRKNFSASESFIPTTGIQERIEAGQHATIQRLAKDIVAELRSAW